MHSPNVLPGPALNMRRPSQYGYPEPISPPCHPPSTKILQSILYNFAHSNFMNNGSRNDHREGRREEQREDMRIERLEERSYPRERTPIERTPSRDRRSEFVINSQNYHPNDVVRNRLHGQEQMSPPYVREMSYLLPMHHAQNDSQSALSRYYQGPSSTITTQNRSRESSQPYPEHYLSPRNRSSSIGSAGSSFRDSRSPSHDSTASRDSMSRCSPLSIGSSPSPSPPTQDTGSKLLGILKGGSYNYSYNSLPTKSLPSLSPQGRTLATEARIHNRHSSISETVTSGSLATVPKWESPCPRNGYIRSNSLDTTRLKRDIRECQDEPIDLSLKQKRQRVDSADRSVSSPSVDSGWGSDYFAPSSGTDDNRNSPLEDTSRKSILESILCGRLASVRDRSRSNSNSPIPKPGTPSRFEYPYSIVNDDTPPPQRREERSISYPLSPLQRPESPCSARSLPASMPPSPVPSIGSQVSVLSTRSRCPWRQRVTLAKKNLLPVSARISDWLVKIINFAKSQPEFSGLPETDKVTLMQHCCTRLMLLYMAETNFQFAVTPVHEDTDDGRPPAISGIDPTEPTMDSVELVQNFIKKCQALQVDAEEFKCLKMYTLFHSGCSGLENSDFVDNISSTARQALQDHVQKSRPDDKLRYSDLLLYLHTLFGVNCGMVQTLFCKHVAKNCNIDQQVRNMVLRRDSTDDLEDDNEDRSDTREHMRSKSTD